jgi:hypothetical protein
MPCFYYKYDRRYFPWVRLRSSPTRDGNPILSAIAVVITDVWYKIGDGKYVSAAYVSQS